MNSLRKKTLISFMALVYLGSLQACILGKSLKTEAVTKANFQGTYTLLLFGGNYSGDIETIALLDKEGDSYTFEPYAPDFRFRAIKGQTADNAIQKAEPFIRSNPSYHSERLRAVLDERGTVIGYELRPLYLPFVYGTSDVLDVDYWIKGDKVIVTIRLKPSVERQDGSDFRQGSRGDN